MKKLILKIINWFKLRKKLKDLAANDPFIYK